MIVNEINRFLTAESQDIPQAILDEAGKLASYSFARQFGKREERPATLRLSSIGSCTRKQAYKILGYEDNGKEIDSRAKQVFFQGDICELAIVSLAKAAGVNITDSGLDQKAIEFDGIQGHADGVITIGDEQAGYERVLLEVKSMSSFSFKNFENQQIDEGYRYQCNAYMEALGLNRTCIVALNKDSGVLAEWIIPKQKEIVDDIRNRIAILRAVTKETLPERPYHPDAKGFLPFYCLYCNVYKTCRPNAERVLVSNRYKLRDPDDGDGSNLQRKQNENTSDGVDVGSVK